MPFVSVTRLRLRSIRFLPEFAVLTLRSIGQVRRAVGFRAGALLVDRRLTFWTSTVWDRENSMRGYMTTGAHRAAMPRLSAWCDEASIAHWTEDGDTPPPWSEAYHRMREEGRPSKLRHPGPAHATLAFREPRTSVARMIKPFFDPDRR